MAARGLQSPGRPGGVIVRTFAARLIALFLTAFLYLLAARELGTTNFGTAAALAGAASLGAVLADTGTSTRVLRDLAEDRGPGSAGYAFQWRATTALGASIVAIGATSILAFRHAGPLEVSLPLALAVWIWATSFEALATAMRIGTGRAVGSAAVIIIDRLAAVGVLLLLIATRHRGPAAMCGALIAGAIAGCISGRRELVEAAILRGNGIRGAMKLAKESSGFLFSGIGAQLQNIDVSVLGLLAGTTAAGILAAPSRLTTPIGVAAASAASIVLAQSRYLDNSSAKPRSILTVTAGVFATTVVGTAPLWLFPGITTRLLLGHQYAPAAAVFRVVAVGACIAAINQPLAAHLQAHSRQRYVGITVLLGGIVGLAVVAALAKPRGAIGGGVGIVTAQVVVLTMLLVALRREGRLASLPKTLDSQ